MCKAWKLCIGLVLSCLLSFQALAQIEMERQSVPSQGLSIEIPKGFVLMSEEMKSVKYPARSAPSVIYTDEQGTVNIAWTVGEFPLPAEQLEQYKDAIVQSIPNYQPSVETVTIDDGKKAFIISFTVKAIDTDVYNAILLTSNNGKSAMFTFNSTVALLDTYKDAGKASLLSIKFDK